VHTFRRGGFVTDAPFGAPLPIPEGGADPEDGRKHAEDRQRRHEERGLSQEHGDHATLGHSPHRHLRSEDVIASPVAMAEGPGRGRAGT
jgi:hypothetical protein